MSKKYEIIKEGLDNYVLKYNNEELKFKSTVKIVESMQSVNKTARMNMIIDLSKKGMTVKDLVIEEKKNGKTYYNNSNKEEIEKAYIQEEASNIFDKVVRETFGKSLWELSQEIGLNEEEEVKTFSEELFKAIVGNTPR